MSDETTNWLELPRKKCSTCGYFRLLDCFGFHKHTADQRDSACRDCETQRKTRWLLAHPEVRRKWSTKRRRVVHVQA